jgi:hypothetical protein
VSPPPRSDDVRTLKRLLREVFADVLKVRGRLDTLEAAAGVSPEGDAPADASAVSRPSASSPAAAAAGAAGGRQGRMPGAVGGALRLGGGLLWAEDEDAGGAVGEVEAAGARLGTDLLLQVGAAPRGGLDAVSAEVRVDPSQERVALRKVLYACRVAPGVRLLLAPFGARGRDAAYTLNPAAGQGLSAAVRHGSPLHSRVLGSMVGAAVDLRRAWLSVAFFSQGERLPGCLAACSAGPCRGGWLGHPGHLCPVPFTCGAARACVARELALRMARNVMLLALTRRPVLGVLQPRRARRTWCSRRRWWRPCRPSPWV